MRRRPPTNAVRWGEAKKPGPTAIAEYLNRKTSPRARKRTTEGEPKLEPVRLKRSGANAWTVVREQGMEPLACSVGRPNRLHVHTVADRSGLHLYLPGARRFVLWCQKFGAPVATTDDKDRCLADCLAWLFHTEEEELQAGKNVFYGVLWAFPELKATALNSRRAMAGWERFALVGERTAVVWEVALAMSAKMREQGHEESADIVELCADACLRMQDWVHLMDDDVIDVSDRGVALLLGRGDRGETTKTGTSQSVRLDFSGTSAMVVKYRDAARRRGGGRVFKVGASTFYAHWNEAAKALPDPDCDPGPPHCLRHTAPSFDMVEQECGGKLPCLALKVGGVRVSKARASWKPYRSLKQVQDRGRWSHEKSVQRYSKTAYYLKAVEKVHPAIVELGHKRREALGQRPRVARE